jgi:hypothetical protein
MQASANAMTSVEGSRIGGDLANLESPSAAGAHT